MNLDFLEIYFNIESSGYEFSHFKCVDLLEDNSD